MAFPEDPLGLKGELRVGTQWLNITADLYTRDAITHTRGRAYRANSADPASCTATIKNLDGKYTPRNPEGPYYGLIGRNTPFQISLPGGPSYLATTDSFVSGIGAQTADAAALDITSDLDVRFDATLDNWDAAGSVELAGKGLLAGNQRSWLLMMRDGKLHFEWSTAGTATTEVNSTEVLPVWMSSRLAVRVTFDVNNGASGNTTVFYYAASIAGPWTQLGAAVVNSGITSIFNSTAPLTVGNGWLDLGFPGPSGKVHAFELRNGIDGSLVANPDFTLQTPGTTAFTDAAGRPWTVNSGSEISDRVIRFSGEVPEWPPEWSTSEKDAWTSVSAAGILRRLGQGQKPLGSTLRRRIPSVPGLMAYWPMEDQETATRASSPIAGVGPLKASPMKWASVDSLPASSPLPAISSVSGGKLTEMTGKVPRPSGTVTSWLVQYLYRLDTVNTTLRTVLRILSTGTTAEWYIQLNNNTSRVMGKDSDGNTLWTGDTATSTDLYNQWIAVQFSAVQSGGTVNWQVVWTDVGGDAGSGSGSFTGSVGYPTGIAGPPDGYSPDIDGLSLGHISVWNTWSTTTVGAYTGAVDAWAGETAGERMIRLCSEQGVPLTMVGDPANTEPVGAQRPATLLSLLSDAAAADGGIFGEVRERRELCYRTRASLYNQDPKLVLDYTGGQIAPPFKPVEDDTIRNDRTVERAGGSSGRAILKTGTLSILDPPDGIGLYEDSTTLNLYSDEQTDPVAGWLLHLATWDEARYPSVTLRLHNHPDLIPDVLDLNVGDKIRIINLPKKFTSSTVELLVDGWSETFRPRAWEITYNCAPAGPYTVAVYNADRRDTGGSTLAADATSTDTALLVTVTAGPLWTTDPIDPPFDILVGGERMTVTKVTGNVQDTFGRIVSSGWGVADSGDTWTTTGGSASDYSVQGA